MRSKFEKHAAALLRKKNIKYKYEHKKVPYTISKDYLPDFYIEKGNYFIETKGYFTSSDRAKLIAVKLNNPGIDLRLWFQRDNYLTKAKKDKYSDWARRQGFKFHVGETFPKEWRDF